jgi:hypothetical protein
MPIEETVSEGTICPICKLITYEGISIKRENDSKVYLELLKKLYGKLRPDYCNVCRLISEESLIWGGK